jgi:hypothetical protein
VILDFAVLDVRIGSEAAYEVAFLPWSTLSQYCRVRPNHAFNRTRRYATCFPQASVAAGRLTWSR